MGFRGGGETSGSLRRESMCALAVHVGIIGWLLGAFNPAQLHHVHRDRRRLLSNSYVAKKRSKWSRMKLQRDGGTDSEEEDGE